MKCTDQIETVILDTVDREEALVAERVLSELLEAARHAVVVELGAGFEERRPGIAVPFWSASMTVLTVGLVSASVFTGFFFVIWVLDGNKAEPRSLLHRQNPIAVQLGGEPGVAQTLHDFVRHIASTAELVRGAGVVKELAFALEHSRELIIKNL